MAVGSIGTGGSIDEFKAAQSAKVADAKSQATASIQSDSASQASSSVGGAQGKQAGQYPAI